MNAAPDLLSDEEADQQQRSDLFRAAALAGVMANPGFNCAEIQTLAERADLAAAELLSFDQRADEENAEAVLAFAVWALAHLQGDSGTGHTYWNQFADYRRGLVAIATAKAARRP